MGSDHPFEIILDSNVSDIDIYKTLSIVKYKTNIAYDHDNIISAFSENKLCITKEFGCIYIRNYGNHVSILFGKLGKKNLIGLDDDSDNNPRIRRYIIDKVILATMYIDHFSEDGKLSLLVFNGGNIKKELWYNIYGSLFNVSKLTPAKFKEKELRNLFVTKYYNSLIEIKYDPASQEEFGNAKEGEYKSFRSKKLNPEAERIKDIIDNPEIKIKKFQSEIFDTYEHINKSCRVVFTIEIEGKISLEFPKIEWIDFKDNYDIEEHYYLFAKKIYDKIISTDIFIDESQRTFTDFWSVE